MNRWHLIRTKARQERWAQSNLWSRNVDVYLPQYLASRRHARRVDRVRRPLFPQYLFVRADLAAGWAPAIRSAPGVAELVSFGPRVGVVPDPVIEALRAREDAAGLIALETGPGYVRGQRVRLLDGHFADQVAIFLAVSDHDRVLLLLDILGRAVRTRVPARSVSPDR
jgi:transcriptional antiterminator RfaH